MKTNKHMNDLHKKIIRKYHTLVRLCGLNEDETQTILATYGVQHSSEMETHDLIDVCGALQKELDKRTGTADTAAEMDRLRKRCLRCLCAYIDARGIAVTDKINYAKQMACRAAKKQSFNRLTAAELRGVIGYFNRERETMRHAADSVPVVAQPHPQAYYMIVGKPLAEA